MLTTMCFSDHVAGHQETMFVFYIILDYSQLPLPENQEPKQ